MVLRDMDMQRHEINPSILNLGNRLKEDLDLQHKLREATRWLAEAEGGKTDVATLQKVRAEYMANVWKLCGGNSSLLAPWFFPKYPKNRPFSFLERPFNMIMMFMFVYSLIVLRGSRQIGKAQPLSEPILTPGGWRTMGDLKVGDMVFGSDGLPCRVTRIFEQGVRNVYRVTFTDGSWTRCDIEHNWKTKMAGCKRWVTRTLKEIMERPGDSSPDSDKAARIPLTAPVEFPERDHELTPYCIGALLGDGDLTQIGVRLTSADPDIVEHVRSGNDPGKRRLSSNLRIELKRLGLLGLNSFEKHIPEEYLFDSSKNRLDLLRGLMDTGGSIFGKCQVEFRTSSDRLMRDMIFLIESLGGKARVKKRTEVYRISATHLTENPFSLKRKADKFYRMRYEQVRILKSVEPDGTEKSRCIMVDSPDHTYITRHCIVTHNSTTLAVLQRMNAHLLRNYSSIYVAPHMNPLETYSRKFLDVERAFRYPVTSNKFKQNMYYKEFPNGSKIDMVRIQTSATPARGKTASNLILDEVQLFDPGLEIELSEVMSDSDIKSAIYAGTSTTTETLLETRYQEGCQAVWHVLRKDGSTINCGNPESVIPYIGPYQMEDPITKEAINPLNGFYVFENPEGFDDRIISVHVPQILNPDKINNPLEWNGIYKTLIRDQKKGIQEKLGIPVEEATREVTRADLKKLCVLPDGPEARMQKCRNGYYRHIISAFDWGGSDYNTLTKTKVSTTCHVIMGVAPDDHIDILHFRRHGGMDYKTIMNLIVKDHVAYRAGALASDFGGGQQYHSLLRTHPNIDPTRHIIFDYSGPESPICASPKTSQLTNMLMLNRTESITALFLGIVAVDPIFRAPSWDECGDYLEDFMNVHRVLVDSERGQKGRRFVYHRHGSKSDDFLHAMNFGYALLRLMFNQALVQDPGARIMIRNAFDGSGGSLANPWASALSSYSRGIDEHD